LIRVAKAAEEDGPGTRLELTPKGKGALAEAMEALGGRLPDKAAAPFSKNPQPDHGDANTARE
jgi:hypothetical protein